jgi:hypothetical protein
MNSREFKPWSKQDTQFSDQKQNVQVKKAHFSVGQFRRRELLAVPDTMARFLALCIGKKRRA